MTAFVGSEYPRLYTPPARDLTPATTRGFEAITFAEDVLGLTLMPWQRWVLLHGLELAVNGSCRFRTLLVVCSRQQGKSLLLQVLALWRMYVDGAPLVLGTAQNLSLAEETWQGALSRAEDVLELAAEPAHVSLRTGRPRPRDPTAWAVRAPPSGAKFRCLPRRQLRRQSRSCS